MLPPRPCREVEGCHWQNSFQGNPPLCLGTPRVPTSCPLAQADELSVLWNPETYDAQGCSWLHSCKTSFIEGHGGVCLPPRLLHPQSCSPKGTRSQSFAPSTSLHRGISRSSTCPIRPHHLEMLSCSILPLGLHQGPVHPSTPPFPWLGSPCWGQDPQPLWGRMRSVRGTYT